MAKLNLQSTENYKVGCVDIFKNDTETIMTVPIDLKENSVTIGQVVLKVNAKHIDAFEKRFENLCKLLVK